MTNPVARVVLVIDEIDALIDLLGARAKALLRYITSKDRSESVCLIAAGQRGTADWMGGSDVRANLDVVCAGRVRRQGEINHAVGTMGPLIPDMASYGEGHAGVWAIVEDSGDTTLAARSTSPSCPTSGRSPGSAGPRPGNSIPSFPTGLVTFTQRCAPCSCPSTTATASPMRSLPPSVIPPLTRTPGMVSPRSPRPPRPPP